MGTTTFSGPVVSNAGFTSDDTLNATDLATGAYNLTDFTVRPAANWSGTVAALVGAANSRTAGVTGGNIFGCYAQTSTKNASNTISGLNTAVYGVVDVGASTNIGTCFGATFDFTSFTGSRASRPTAFIGFGDEAQNSLGVLNLFAVGTPSKNVSSGASGNVMFCTAAPGAVTDSIRITVNGNIRYINLSTAQV